MDRGNFKIDFGIEIIIHTHMEIFLWLVCIEKLIIAKWGFVKGKIHKYLYKLGWYSHNF
jgi:hypothetical protein